MSKRLAMGIILIALAVAAVSAGKNVSGISQAQSGQSTGELQLSAMEGYASKYHPAHIGSEEAWKMINSKEGAIMLDVRSEASYLENHVSGAFSVPYETLAEYAVNNIPDKNTVIICYCFCDDKGGPALSAYYLLTGIGYSNVFYTEPGSEWLYEGASISTGEVPAGMIISGERAKELYDASDSVILLDVRSQEEYDSGYIEGSVLIPAEELPARLSELPEKSAVIIVYCRSGLRSKAASDTLAGYGYKNVYDMQSINNWPGALAVR